MVMISCGAVPMSPDRPATIGAVAQQAGVSIASVSRVINNDQRVGDDIRRRVELAIREMNYRPNAAARSLRAQSTRQLGLVVDDIANPAYIEIMRSLQTVARDAGRRVLLQSTDGRDDEELAILRSLGQRYVDGLVMTSTRFAAQVVQALGDAAVPVVVIGSHPDIPVDCVTTDAGGGVRSAVQHLIDQGCRRLAMINGPAETLPAQTRLHGFVEGAAEGGAVVSMVLHGDWGRSAGRQAAERILDIQPRPDAIVCANDQLALGVLDTCRDRDVAVPGDLALVGVDNTRDASVCRPGLTSLDLSFAERGRIAGRLLLDRISGDVTGHRQTIDVESSLVIRESSLFGDRS